MLPSQSTFPTVRALWLLFVEQILEYPVVFRGEEKGKVRLCPFVPGLDLFTFKTVAIWCSYISSNAVFFFFQDFGEYQESYYSVQTTEGEQISQLIAGYIDIILKKVFPTDTEWKSCFFLKHCLRWCCCLGKKQQHKTTLIRGTWFTNLILMLRLLECAVFNLKILQEFPF